MTVVNHSQLNKMEVIQNKLHEKLPACVGDTALSHLVFLVHISTGRKPREVILICWWNFMKMRRLL